MWPVATATIVRIQIELIHIYLVTQWRLTFVEFGNCRRWEKVAIIVGSINHFL